MRFYLKYIEPNKEKIERDAYSERSITLIPGWEGAMGLQFENLVLNNRAKMIELLNLHYDEVVYDNPYFQNKTTRQEGCQIDYLIQTRFDTLYVCEIKFSKKTIKNNIIAEVQEKMDRLKPPRHISMRPVLIHVNEVSEEVVNSRFFSHIINFGQLLEA